MWACDDKQTNLSAMGVMDLEKMELERTKEFIPDWFYIRVGGGASFVMSICIFKLLSPLVSSRFTISYSSLPNADKSDWNDRIISNFNSVISIALSTYSLWTEDGMRDDMVWYDSRIARLACSVIIGYMVADIFIMLLWCHVGIKELIGFVCHHLATVFAYFYVSVYGILCYFAMLRLLAEVSTPAMNQRWFFDASGYKRGSIVVVLNGCLMLVTFFLFRIVVLPLFWYQIWVVTGTDSVTKLGHIQYTVMYLPSLILDALNIYWFYKMCKGFVKAVKTMMRKSDKDNVQYAKEE